MGVMRKLESISQVLFALDEVIAVLIEKLDM